MVDVTSRWLALPKECTPHIATKREFPPFGYFHPLPPDTVLETAEIQEIVDLNTRFNNGVTEICCYPFEWISAGFEQIVTLNLAYNACISCILQFQIFTFSTIYHNSFEKRHSSYCFRSLATYTARI